MVFALELGKLIIPGILIAVVTSFLTVRLAIRQFYAQKWWERKQEAYSEIMEALFRFQRYHRRWMYIEGKSMPVSNEHAVNLGQEYDDAVGKLEKAAAIGAYIISDEAAALIDTVLREENRLLQEMVNERISSMEYFSGSKQAIDTCIATLRDVAKRDLRVN